ncbi:MAG: AAA family ATPase, partial [Ferruginibacter sp.]
MLSKLYIQNYAIIDLLEITFSDKLNIITGETGAGKSILMGALNLILGERADASALQTGAKKCIVEGTFSQASPQVNDFFIANNLEEGEEIIMRREVAVGGKSRAFINDTPVNLAQLKELGLLLVDLHQQFDTLELSSLNFQRMVLDALGKNATLLSQFRKVYMQYVEIKKELENLLAMQAAAEKEMGYHQFLFDELQALHLQPDELEQADLQLAALSNAENNKQQLLAVYFQLKDAEQPIVQQLKVLQQKLGGLSKYFPTIEALHQRIGSTVIELKDVADELENVETGIHYDPAQIELLNERLAQGYKLQKKHGVQSTAALLAIQAALSTKLEAVHTAGEQIENYTKETTKLESQAREIAKRISANRHAAIAPFVKKVNALLTQVGMPNANLKVV